MRWALLSALVSLLTVQVGLCQPPVSRDRSIVLYQETAEALPRPPGDRADEITELKGAVLQLQQRVDQLTPSSDQTTSNPSFTNVWFGVNDIPYIGTLRAGWMKEPIGYEHLTSSRWLNFMEKSPGGDSLGLHSPGILLMNCTDNQRVTWAAG